MTVVNFLEGTRFTAAKHDNQQSPYRHLLKPKAGGVAFVLAALGDNLDVTILYPAGAPPGFWDLLCGRVDRVVVDVQTRPLEPALWRSDYQEDPVFRAEMQQWVSDLWAQKDARLVQMAEQESEGSAQPAERAGSE